MDTRAAQNTTRHVTYTMAIGNMTLLYIANGAHAGAARAHGLRARARAWTMCRQVRYLGWMCSEDELAVL